MAVGRPFIRVRHSQVGLRRNKIRHYEYMAFVTLSIESTSRSLALNDALVRQVSPIAGGWILPRGEYLQYLWRPGGIGAACKIRGISPDIKILILAMHSALQLDLTPSIPIDSSSKIQSEKLQTDEERPRGDGGKFPNGAIGWRSDEEKNNWTRTRHRNPGSWDGIPPNARRKTGAGER